MNIKDACEVLEVNINSIQYEEVRNQYLKKCLMYHPDKGNKPESFLKIKEAYDILLKEIEGGKLKKKGMETGYEKNKHIELMEIVLQYFDNKINIYEKFKFIYESLTQKEKNELKKVMFTIRKLIPNSIYLLLYGSDIEYTVIKPSLNDLVNHNIYALTFNDSKYYIPTWHKEVYFDKLCVLCEPVLPSNVKIDMLNNVHIYISENIGVLLTRKINIKIEDLECCINSDKIFIKPEQMICLKKKGIPKIGDNIYSDKDLSNIYVHLYLS